MSSVIFVVGALSPQRASCSAVGLSASHFFALRLLNGLNTLLLSRYSSTRRPSHSLGFLNSHSDLGSSGFLCSMTVCLPSSSRVILLIFSSLVNSGGTDLSRYTS